MPLSDDARAKITQKMVHCAKQVRTSVQLFRADDVQKRSKIITAANLKLMEEYSNLLYSTFGSEGDPANIAGILLDELSKTRASAKAQWTSNAPKLSRALTQCKISNNSTVLSDYEGYIRQYRVTEFLDNDPYVDISALGGVQTSTSYHVIPFGKLKSWLEDRHFTVDGYTPPMIEVGGADSTSIHRAIDRIAADCTERVKLNLGTTGLDVAKLDDVLENWTVGRVADSPTNIVYVQRKVTPAKSSDAAGDASVKDSFAGGVKEILERTAICYHSYTTLLYNIIQIKPEVDPFALYELRQVLGEWTLLSAIVQYVSAAGPEGGGNHFVNITATGNHTAAWGGEYTCYDDYKTTTRETLEGLTELLTESQHDRSPQRTAQVTMVVYMKTVEFKPLYRLPHGIANPGSACWISSAVLFVMSVQNMWPEAPVPVEDAARTPQSNPNGVRSGRLHSAGRSLASVHSISAEYAAPWTVELVYLSDETAGAPKCLETYVDTESCRVYIANNEPGDAIDLCNEIVYVMMASGHPKFCVDVDLQAKFEECRGGAGTRIWQHITVLDLTGKRIIRSRAVFSAQEHWKADLHDVNLTVWDAMQLHDHDFVGTGSSAWKDLSKDEQTTVGKKYAANITQAYNNQEGDGVNTRSSVASKWSSCSYEEQHEFIQSIISGGASLSNAVVATVSPLNSDDDSSEEEEDSEDNEAEFDEMEDELGETP